MRWDEDMGADGRGIRNRKGTRVQTDQPIFASDIQPAIFLLYTGTSRCPVISFSSLELPEESLTVIRSLNIPRIHQNSLLSDKGYNTQTIIHLRLNLSCTSPY